jgi:hypothetical protein
MRATFQCSRNVDFSYNYIHINWVGLYETAYSIVTWREKAGLYNVHR